MQTTKKRLTGSPLKPVTSSGFRCFEETALAYPLRELAMAGGPSKTAIADTVGGRRNDAHLRGVTKN